MARKQSESLFIEHDELDAFDDEHRPTHLHDSPRSQTYPFTTSALWALLQRYARRSEILILPAGSVQHLRWTIRNEQPEDSLILALSSGQIDSLILTCDLNSENARYTTLLLDPLYTPGSIFSRGRRKGAVDHICTTVLQAIEILGADSKHRIHERHRIAGSAWMLVDDQSWRAELCDISPTGIGVVIPEKSQPDNPHPILRYVGSRINLERRPPGTIATYHATIVYVDPTDHGIRVGLRLLAS